MLFASWINIYTYEREKKKVKLYEGWREPNENVLNIMRVGIVCWPHT